MSIHQNDIECVANGAQISMHQVSHLAHLSLDVVGIIEPLVVAPLDGPTSRSLGSLRSGFVTTLLSVCDQLHPDLMLVTCAKLGAHCSTGITT